MMRKLTLVLAIIVMVCSMAQGQMQTNHDRSTERPVFKTGKMAIDFSLDGKNYKGGWNVAPNLDPDVLETTASKIIFASDIDTLIIDNLKEWESFDFDIVGPDDKKSHVRVDRHPSNPFESPDPELLKIAASGKLTREQARYDLDALIYSLSQIHPDIFSVCRQEDLFRAVNRAKASFADSVTYVDLYKAAAPIVAMIGDGHTNLLFPTKKLLTTGYRRMPLFVDVRSDRSMICKSSLDSIIPRGAKILDINKVSTDSILNAMMPYVSGERLHYKLSRVNNSFQGLYHALFGADAYEITYQIDGANKVTTSVFPAITWNEIKERCPTTRIGKKAEAYSYVIDEDKNVAVMDFLSFKDVDRMEQFADSMFNDLRTKKIGNLIIDIRNNGGGSSNVGDVLLRYITPKPFVQLEKALIRITPLSAKLIGGDATPTFMFQEVDTTQYLLPRRTDEGHYDGNVYLLTSNRTFSSAGSFSWVFKECGMGTVIGEETGGMNVCYGDVLMYKMPISQLSASVSFKRFWQFGADEDDIHGTLPDVAVPSDEALDKALELVKESDGRRK